MFLFRKLQLLGKAKEGNLRTMPIAVDFEWWRSSGLFSRLLNLELNGSRTKRKAEKMSITGALTVDDFLVSLSNIQSENFASMQETLNMQTTKLEAIENLLKEMKTDRPEAESENLENPFAVKLEKPLASPTQVKVDPEVVEEEEEKEVATNFKDIHCFDCLRTFVRGSGAFTHHLRNTSCKPYQCQCGKLFKKKSTLKAHKSTHSAERFACHCGSIFRCELYLKNHQRRVHLGTKNAVTSIIRVTDQTPPQTVKSQNPPDEEFFTPMNLLKLQMSEQEE